MDRKVAKKKKKHLDSREAVVGQCEMVGAWLGEVTPERGNKAKLYVSE